MWNLIHVQLPEIVDADNSQSPMGGTGSSTPCLATSSWYAGAKRVIARLLDGPRDRKHREEAMKQLAEFKQRFGKQPPASPSGGK